MIVFHLLNCSTPRLLYFGLGRNRGDRIRTCDLSVPNAALYQAELRPVLESLSLSVSTELGNRFGDPVFSWTWG